MKQGLIHFIAGRYLFSRKSHSVINVISVVSAVAVAVPAAAMLILLSVHNGLNDFIVSLNSRFDPPLKVSLREGRYFTGAEIDLQALRALPDVETVGEVLEDNALFGYRERQLTGVVRGVDSLYPRIVPIREVVTHGRYPETEGALPGMGIAYQLGISANLEGEMDIYVPRSVTPGFLTPGSFYNRIGIVPSGVYSLDVQTDGKYVLIPLERARRLYERPGAMTALVVKVREGASLQRVKEEIGAVAGERFRVETRLEQQEAQYKILKQEKLAIYLILFLVLVIASFTLIGAVIMLIVEKQKECETLRVLGMEREGIRKIFVRQGLYISLAGIALGAAAGLGIAFAQQRFGLVTLGGSMLIDAYPVRVSWMDALAVTGSVLLVNWLIVRFTVNGMIRREAWDD